MQPPEQLKLKKRLIFGGAIFFTFLTLVLLSLFVFRHELYARGINYFLKYKIPQVEKTQKIKINWGNLKIAYPWILFQGIEIKNQALVQEASLWPQTQIGIMKIRLSWEDIYLKRWSQFYANHIIFNWNLKSPEIENKKIENDYENSQPRNSKNPQELSHQNIDHPQNVNPWGSKISNFFQKFRKTLQRLRRYSESSIELEDIELNITNKDQIPILKIEKGKLLLFKKEFTLRAKAPQNQALFWEGTWDKNKFTLEQKLPLKIELPSLNHAKISLDCQRATLDASLQEDGISMKTDFFDLAIEHPALADQKVSLERLRIEPQIYFKNNEVSWHQNFSLGQLQGKLDMDIQDIEQVPKLKVQLRLDPASDLAWRQNWPKPILGQVQNLSFSGFLGFEIDASFDFENLDKTRFDSFWLREKFIPKLSGVDVAKLQGSFSQAVFDGLSFKRAVLVSPENPFFVSFDKIPQHFINLLLTNEDSNFFRHQGFNEEAFRKALILNWKSKKFKRGASTISMQFVKNIFLSRQKTLARKAQEIFVTWWIESQKLISKQRMLEIYLNIIEFGPNVYGLGEAAQFYFQKLPSELNWEESLFLVSIIPAPKKYSQRLNEDGHLKDFAKNQMNFIWNRYLKLKGLPFALNNPDKLDIENMRVKNLQPFKTEALTPELDENSEDEETLELDEELDPQTL